MSLPFQELSWEPHRTRGLHSAVLRITCAGPARLFDYKSPGILWDVHTRIPIVVGAEAALAEAPEPVFLPVGSCSP